jgi:hypothetical protein
MACTWDAGGGDMRAGVVAAGTRWVFDPVHAGTHDSDYGGSVEGSPSDVQGQGSIDVVTNASW